MTTKAIEEKKIRGVWKDFCCGVDTYTDREGNSRIFNISKMTKCFIFWIEMDTNCYYNNHKIFKTKKHFCDTRNCMYFTDNTNGIIYADKTYI